jgi:hypothetical protein
VEILSRSIIHLNTSKHIKTADHEPEMVGGETIEIERKY